LHKVDGLRIFAENLIAQKGIDFVVMGHRHAPQLIILEKGTYVNLGDWIHSYTYGVFDEHGFRIENARV
jgi:UDP-2,3-diacylglucosamine hydrolase